MHWKPQASPLPSARRTVQRGSFRSKPMSASARRRGQILRAALVLAVAGLGVVIRTPRPVRGAGVNQGIDPLEVLKLQVRANAIVLLDTSGSMRDTANGGNLTGDDPRSKLYIAKQALKRLVQDNQTTVSFQLLKYYQTSLGQNLGLDGNDRFLYRTTSESYVPVGAPIVINPAAAATGAPSYLRR